VLHQGQETIGYLFVEGGSTFTLNDERQLVSRLSRAALTAGLVAAALSLLLAILLSIGLLRPIRALTQAATRLAHRDLSQRVQVRGDDEVAQLGRTFNQMADSLQRAENSRREMTADIAHELRNPLAVQRANLEALQDGVFPLTPESLDPILEQNLLLTRLVDDLRTLALADAGQLELQVTPTDFPALVRRVCERFTAQANASQVRLSLDVSSGVADNGAAHSLRLDPLRVEQILNNLLSNALRHTPQGGKVTVRLDSDEHRARLSVRDSGPGIPPEALPAVFERFFRADRSRSRSEGGTGLGLAIARQLAEAHGGSLNAANHPEGGAEFCLTLPGSGEKQD
jgi:signal transduction histidine kinase